MTVVFRSVKGKAELGGTIPVMKAFAEMGALSPGEEHEHLMAIPLYGEPLWDEEGTENVRREAADMLERYGDKLSATAVEVLNDLINLGQIKASLFQESAVKREEKGSGVGGRFATQGKVPDKPEDPLARVAWEAQRFLARKGFAVPGDLSITFNTDNLSMHGAITLDSRWKGAIKSLGESFKQGRTRPLRRRHIPVDAAKLMLHEMLHQLQGVPAYQATLDDPVTPEWAIDQPADTVSYKEGYWLEEGVVDAVAIDLSVDLVRELTGRKVSAPAPDYRDQVDAVRKASARATNKPWTSPAAKRWRRNLLKMPFDQRRTAWHQAGGA